MKKYTQFSDFSPATIKSERIILRPLEETDALATWKLMSPTIAQWTSTWPPNVSLSFVRKRIKELLIDSANGIDARWVIECRKQNGLLGWIGLRKPSRSAHTASFGCWLGDEFQGNGYGTDAAIAVIQYAAEHTDLQTIEAEARSDNLPSNAVISKIGFSLVGKRRCLNAVNQSFESNIYEIKLKVKQF